MTANSQQVVLRYWAGDLTDTGLRAARAGLQAELEALARDVDCVQQPTTRIASEDRALVVTMHVCPSQDREAAVTLARTAVLTAAGRIGLVLHEPVARRCEDAPAL